MSRLGRKIIAIITVISMLCVWIAGYNDKKIVAQERIVTAQIDSATIAYEGNTWTLENNTLKMNVSFENGSIQMKSFYNKAAKKEYLRDNSDSYLFSYTYGEYISGTVWSYNDYKTNATVPSAGKNTITMRSDDGSWSLGKTKISDISMNTENGQEALGKRLEITISNARYNFQNRLVFDVYDGDAGFHYQNYVKNTGSKKMVITHSDVISLSFPNGPHYLHYVNAKSAATGGGAENSNWKTVTGSMPKNTGRNALNVYTAGDGFWIMPETNWRTQDGPDVKGAKNEGTKTFNEFATTSIIAGGSSDANASVIKVACVGDSITEGVCASSGMSYPSQLKILLGNAFEVKNFGVSGRTLLKKGDYPYWNESAYIASKNYLPDVVIIMLGTNDSKERNWAYKSEFKSNYIELINQYKNLSSNPKVYVGTSPMVVKDSLGIRKSVVDNEILPLEKEIAKETGCEIIDINALTQGHDDWFAPDCVHPNDTGYTKLTKCFASAVNNYKKDSMGSMVVKVSTNPQSMQLTLKPNEEFQYIGVNLALFQGDIVDGKMAAEEHFYKRFKFHDTSTIINTNDWDYIGKRSYDYFKNIVIPKAKEAKIDMIMLDDLWNTDRDSITAISSLKNLSAFSDLVTEQGFKLGLWYSLTGEDHNRGRDLANPQMVQEKKEQIRSLIRDYKMSHQMIDLTEFWQNKSETEYSSPCDNVYRKNVLSNQMLNELVEEYPQFMVKLTNEVDVFPTPGNRNTGLLHLVNNGWIVHSGGLSGFSVAANAFGYLPLSTYYNGGKVDGSMSLYYNYMFARNTKLNTDPGGSTWTSNGIDLMAKFNDWRNAPRVKELTDSIKRPTYLGEGWNYNSGSEKAVAGPYSWMYINSDKSRALMIATSYTSVAKKFRADTRWLDSNKRYYVADVTLDDVGEFTYKYKGVYRGADLAENGFDIDLTENTSGGKAIWFEAVENDSMQVVYADDKVQSYSGSVNDGILTVNVKGEAGETATVIVADAENNLGRVCPVVLDDNGCASISVSPNSMYEPNLESTVPNLGNPVKVEYEELVDAKKVRGSSSGVSFSATSTDASPSGGRYGQISFSNINDYANLIFDVPAAGQYDIELAYKVNEKSGKVSLGQNGQRISETVDHSLGNLNTWKIQSVRVNFDRAGENTLQIFYDGIGERESAPSNQGKSIRIDYIKYTPYIMIEPITYEAEKISGVSVENGGNLYRVENINASAGKCIRTTSDTAGTIIHLPIHVERAGNYQVDFNYLSAPDGGRICVIKDGRQQGDYIEQYSSSTETKNIALGTMHFDTEDTEITFMVTGRSQKNTKGYNAYIDSFTLSPVPGVELEYFGDTVQKGQRYDLSQAFRVVNMQTQYCVSPSISYKIISESAFDIGEIANENIFVANNYGTIVIRGTNKYAPSAYQDFTITVLPDGVSIEVAEVIKKINQIGQITFTAQCRKAIETAKKEYHMLSAEEMKKVSNSYLLKSAGNKYKTLEDKSQESEKKTGKNAKSYVEDLDCLYDGSSRITPGSTPYGDVLQYTENGTIYNHGFGYEPFCDNAEATGTMIVRIPEGADKFYARVGLGVSASRGNTYDQKNVINFKINRKLMATTGKILKNYVNGQWVDNSVSVAFDIPENTKWLVIENNNGGCNHADHIILTDAYFVNESALAVEKLISEISPENVNISRFDEETAKKITAAEEAYYHLEINEREMVSNASLLVTYRETHANFGILELTDSSLKNKIDAVNQKIAQIPNFENIGLDNMAEILKAYDAYHSLTEVEKKYVNNIHSLTLAYEFLEETYPKELVEVTEVIQKIKELGAEDEISKINSVRETYIKMSSYEVRNGVYNYEKLKALLGDSEKERDAFTVIKATSFDNCKNVVIDYATGGVPHNIGGVRNGSFVKYDNVIFDKNAEFIELDYACQKGNGGYAYIYVDQRTEGQCIAKIKIESTGLDWSNYTSQKVELQKEILKGKHTIYICFESEQGYVVNLRELRFYESQGSLMVNENVRIEGYQISPLLGGNRVVGSVEQQIDGQRVKNWGLIYAVAEVHGECTGISASDMYIGTDSPYISDFQSTDNGTAEKVVFGESKTATYFVRTMLFPVYTEDFFHTQYRVRAYALLEDGTYRYSEVKDYSVYEVADELYSNKRMSNFVAHEYLFNRILKVGNNDYKEVDYDWGNSIAKFKNAN
ncbi:GDSL-type esterase/lipase family protein [Eubacterium sp.]|uniref:GDSL-type esterase/lipase family protein n=1 Tax=Eubacterium sp. TaxID=142586 RepID=UPI00399A89A9